MDILKILREQSEDYQEILSEKLNKIKDKSEIYMNHSTIFKDFYSHAYKPITERGKNEKLSSSNIEETLRRIKSDINISHDQLGEVSNDISNTYNSTQDYKTGLKNKVKYLTSLLSDVNIMIGEEEENSVVFKDSLSNYDFIDESFSSGKTANISTSEGIATLSILSDENITEKAASIIIGGNGEEGNYKVIKKVNIETSNTDYDIYAKLKSSENPKDNPDSIIDSSPNTWIEYQKIGIPEEYRSRYKFDWGDANEIRDELSFRVNIELDKVRKINWIDISQYIPEKSNAAPKIYSVKTSTDGSHYDSIYSTDIIDQRISSISQNHLDSQVFNKIENVKLTSQGILSFSPVQSKYIEIILKQDIPYNEILGDYYYTRTIKSNGEIVTKEIINGDLVPKNVIDGPPGIYRVN